MDYGIWRNILEVNLLAPFKVAVAFHDHIAASSTRLLVMMSSGLASHRRQPGPVVCLPLEQSGAEYHQQGYGA